MADPVSGIQCPEILFKECHMKYSRNMEKHTQYERKWHPAHQRHESALNPHDEHDALNIESD